MSDRLSEIEARLTAVERRLDHLESREPVAAARTAGAAGRAPQPPAREPTAGFKTPEVGSVFALFGRTFFVLAGAFLLRALTDAGRLEASLGVLIGLVFAAVWIVMADRAGGRGQRESAVFHGVAFLLIAFPLLFEATTRFGFLTAATAAAGLGGCTAIALAAAWRQRLRALAWIATLGGLATAAVLAVATAELGPFALFLVLVGVAVLWFGYMFEWTLLRWPAAMIADLALLILSVRAATPTAADTPRMAFAAQVLLLGAYLGSFATRALVLNRDVIPFEVAQSIAAIIVGLGGAAFLMQMTGGSWLPLGAVTLALAVGCYGAAAVFVERRRARRKNYHFFASAALVFALLGVGLSVPSTTVGVVFAVLGVAAAGLGRLSNRVTYRAHGAAYLTAGIVATGLLPYVIYGLGGPVMPDGRPSIPMLGVLALCGVAMWGLRPVVTAPSPRRRVPRLVVLVLLLGGLLGTAVTGLLPPPASPDAAAPGIVAVLRTALLVAGTLVMALASRAWGFKEGAWLVYPLLIVTGVKFLLEDLRTGEPAILFACFALYGLALIVGPRLYRRPGSAEGAAPSRPPS